jgi:hypothetical protein
MVELGRWRTVLGRVFRREHRLHQKERLVVLVNAKEGRMERGGGIEQEL